MKPSEGVSYEVHWLELFRRVRAGEGWGGDLVARNPHKNLARRYRRVYNYNASSLTGSILDKSSKVATTLTGLL